MTPGTPPSDRPDRDFGQPEPGQLEPGQLEPGQWEPGQWVCHPGQPDWGPGQVQSAVGHRVTVMFEDAGKLLIDSRVVPLRLLDGPEQA